MDPKTREAEHDIFETYEENTVLADEQENIAPEENIIIEVEAPNRQEQSKKRKQRIYSSVPIKRGKNQRDEVSLTLQWHSRT